MRERPPFRPDVVVVRVWRAGRFAEQRTYGRDAAEHGRVDTAGYAARLILADEEKLGRRRARSGAEKLLRAAGFSDPGRMYAFAMDRIAQDRRAVAA